MTRRDVRRAVAVTAVMLVVAAIAARGAGTISAMCVGLLLLTLAALIL